MPLYRVIMYSPGFGEYKATVPASDEYDAEIVATVQVCTDLGVNIANVPYEIREVYEIVGTEQGR